MERRRAGKRIKWMTVVGFLSFETTQRAICQIVGQWIPFHYFYRTLNVARSQNPKSTFHRAGMTKCGPIQWNGEKFHRMGDIYQKSYSEQEFCTLLSRNKSMLSRFCNGKKIESQVLRDYKTKFY